MSVETTLAQIFKGEDILDEAIFYTIKKHQCKVTVLDYFEKRSISCHLDQFPDIYDKIKALVSKTHENTSIKNKIISLLKNIQFNNPRPT